MAFGRWSVAAVIGGVLLAALPPRRVAAQIPTPTIDTMPGDSARTDSLRRDATDRLLAAEVLNTQRVPVLPDLGSEGPRAARSRLVLDRRSIAWRTAQSVADLLNEVPGVYLWRGGWFGRPVYANYHGRGATSIDWVVDGVPYLPMGPDSVGVDPSLFSLTLFERIEVERWPGGLRVLLYTPQHQWLAPRSRVGVTTGGFDIARYQGDLEYRWKNGLGVTGAAEYFDAPTGTGLNTNATITSGLFRFQYVPRADRGVQIQLLTSGPDLKRYVTGGDTIGSGLKGARRDLQARAYLRSGTEAHHLQADVLYTSSRWSGDSADQTVSGGGVSLALQRPRWRIAGTTWLRDRWTPFTIRGEVGVAPTPILSMNAVATHEKIDGGRQSDWIGVRGSLQLPFGFEADAGLQQGSRVVAPSLMADTGQDISELEVRGRWRSRLLTVEAGWTRTEAFSPYRFAPYLQVGGLRPLGRTQWLEAGAVVTPLTWMTLEGWYSDPRGVAPDGLPPTHTTVRGELRSRFLRKFPSGIFELRLAGEMETWGRGTLGTDTLGAAVPLRGATFFRLGAALKLGGFQFFWDRVNTQSTKRTYVPGFKIPPLGQTFGVRWEFSN